MIQISAEEVIRNPQLEENYWVSWEIMCTCCKRFPENILEDIRRQVRAGATVRQAAANNKNFRVCCINLLATPSVISLCGNQQYRGNICNPSFAKPQSIPEPEDFDQVEAFLMGRTDHTALKSDHIEGVQLEDDDVGGDLYIDPLLDMGGKIEWTSRASNTYMAD